MRVHLAAVHAQPPAAAPRMVEQNTTQTTETVSVTTDGARTFEQRVRTVGGAVATEMHMRDGDQVKTSRHVTGVNSSSE